MNDTKDDDALLDDKVNLQPLVDALAPQLPGLIEKWTQNGQASAVESWRIERGILWLGAGVVAIAGTLAIMAALQGNWETAKSIAFPLITFAGGLGIGSRLTKGHK